MLRLSENWRDWPAEEKQKLLARLQERNGGATDQYRAFKRQYRHDPVAFVQDCFDWRTGQGATAYQSEILAALPAKRRVAVRGPHGLGKTTLASWVVLWFALTRDGEDWKLATTASAWRQLTKFLWPEIRKWARRLRWEKIGRGAFDERRELQLLSLKLMTGEAFAVASDNPAMIEGAHADSLLYVFDESKAIPEATFDAAEGAFSGDGIGQGVEAYALAISTPGEPQGRFYDIHARRPGLDDWYVRHVTLDEAIQAGRVSAAWAAQREKQWSKTSAVYQNRVLGEFAASDEDGIIPLAWIEAANERWQEWVDAGRPGTLKALGVDVGRGGDKTTLARRVEWAEEDLARRTVIGNLERDGKADTMAVAGRVAGILRAQPGAVASVDVIGIGAGVVDRLREQGLSVSAFNAAERSAVLDRSGELGFVNKRSEGWWRLREMLDPTYGEWVGLPSDDTLTGDLTAPHYRIVSGGKIQVESKDDIRKRLGRSTDDGDAVMMACSAEGGGLFAWGMRDEDDEDE